MELSRKHFRIAEILAAFFTKTQTKDDEKEYEAWEKEQKGNGDFARRVLELDNYIRFERMADRFDQREGWKVFEDYLATKFNVDVNGTDCLPRSNKSFKRTLNRFRRVIGYAAVGIILLVCGVFYWINRPDGEEKEPVFAYQIKAGTSGAYLTMEDGEVVTIVKDRTFLLKEVDGTVIVTDSTGIDYIAHEVRGEKEVWNTIRTLAGMEYTLTLSDGTRINLNAESEIHFPVSFRSAQRVVELSGEAYFEVAKDAEHPFVVKTKHLSVKVLGTSFNCRAYEDEGVVTTTLAEGKVQVFNGQKFKDIMPGEQIVYEKETEIMRVNRVEISYYTAWRDGKFIFRNERLEDMMAYLARWYNVKYQFMDDDAKNVRIGAKLNRYDNMNPIIDMLKKNSLMKITLKDSVYLISSKE